MIGLQCSGSTGWGYVGEISSQRLRAHTAGFAAALSCVMGVVMNVLVPYMLSADAWNWGLKTAFFYLGIGAPFAIASWFIIPETTGWVIHLFSLIRHGESFSPLRLCADSPPAARPPRSSTSSSRPKSAHGGSTRPRPRSSERSRRRRDSDRTRVQLKSGRVDSAGQQVVGVTVRVITHFDEIQYCSQRRAADESGSAS